MTKDELLDEMKRVKKHTLYSESDGCAMVPAGCLDRWMDAVKALRDPTADYPNSLSARINACERDIALITETLSEAARKVCPDL